MTQDGDVRGVLIDVGGFLGIGSHTVTINVEQVDILWNDAEDDVHVEVPMTEEEVRAMPEYQESDRRF